MVLPPASHKHLPEALWPLVLEEGSPIADLFPAQFHTDGEGKRADYEAVVLLPFVDKERLIAAFDAVPADKFAPGELKRNDVGNILVFTHLADSTETDFCKSTLLAYARDVGRPESRCIRKPPVPALPDGQPGFEPNVLEVCCSAAARTAGLHACGEQHHAEHSVASHVPHASKCMSAACSVHDL